MASLTEKTSPVRSKNAATTPLERQPRNKKQSSAVGSLPLLAPRSAGVVCRLPDTTENSERNTRSAHLFERDESARVGGADTRAPVPHRFVGDGEVAEVVAHHLWLDLNAVESLAVVHTHHTANHLRNADHAGRKRKESTREGWR